ncbi:Eco29kI family restriction endonuclease [Catellatospora sp. NPDC049609]|uniref:Eco29kI family restriction endonuclease n=1 Tax=Catellatospora sp. NPDC049609 TaxID=3155505 RepID=UPI00343F38ED
MPASAEFRLSITRALGDQLGEALAELTPAPLTPDQINKIAGRPGVYQLYQDGDLVYIGKAEKSLPHRLREHYEKVSGRRSVGRMTFTCLYVDEDLHAVAPETLLIRRHKGDGKAVWNHNGFGLHDPGKQRDTTVVKPTHFDALYPINLDWVCEDIEPGAYTADVLLARVKETLPYLFRYQADDIHKTIKVELRDTTPTADELFTLLASAITDVDARWQITALPGYVIMYPSKGPYPNPLAIYS